MGWQDSHLHEFVFSRKRFMNNDMAGANGFFYPWLRILVIQSPFSAMIFRCLLEATCSSSRSVKYTSVSSFLKAAVR